MGIKYIREYSDIFEDLSQGVIEIENIYDIFEMTKDEWQSLSETEKEECSKTLADDIFYGLGEEPFYNLGNGSINYIQQENIIKIIYENNNTKIISLA